MIRGVKCTAKLAPKMLLHDNNNNNQIMHTTDPAPGKTERHPYYEGETSPISVPRISQTAFRIRNSLIVEPGGEIATHLCVKTGRPSRHELVLALRSPWNPVSWFAPFGKIRVGLCRRSLENYRVTRAIAWFLIVTGCAALGAGFVFGASITFGGVLLALTGALIRAAFPIWSLSDSEEALIIRGCGENFLCQYPTKKN